MEGNQPDIWVDDQVQGNSGCSASLPALILHRINGLHIGIAQTMNQPMNYNSVMPMRNICMSGDESPVLDYSQDDTIIHE